MEEGWTGVEITEDTLEAAAYYADLGMKEFASNNPPRANVVAGVIFCNVEYDPDDFGLKFIFEVDWGGAEFRIIPPEGIEVIGNINGNGLEEVTIDYIFPNSADSSTKRH